MTMRLEPNIAKTRTSSSGDTKCPQNKNNITQDGLVTAQAAPIKVGKCFGSADTEADVRIPMIGSLVAVTEPRRHDDSQPAAEVMQPPAFCRCAGINTNEMIPKRYLTSNRMIVRKAVLVMPGSVQNTNAH